MLYIFITIFLGTTPKSKPNKLSPGASNKKRKLTNTPKKEKKDEAKNVNGTEIVKNTQVENEKNTQVENDTVESEQEKEESIPSETKFASDKTTKTKKTVKKKRARIIEPIDSSDDEGHLSVNFDHSKIDNSLAKEFIFLIKFISL